MEPGSSSVGPAVGRRLRGHAGGPAARGDVGAHDPADTADPASRGTGLLARRWAYRDDASRSAVAAGAARLECFATQALAEMGDRCRGPARWAAPYGDVGHGRPRQKAAPR